LSLRGVISLLPCCSRSSRDSLLRQALFFLLVNTKRFTNWL
jgi:hypothetical protein